MGHDDFSKYKMGLDGITCTDPSEDPHEPWTVVGCTVVVAAVVASSHLRTEEENGVWQAVLQLPGQVI